MKRMMQLPELLMRKRRRDRAGVFFGCLLALCCTALLVTAVWLGMQAASRQTLRPPEAKPALQTADFQFAAALESGNTSESLIRFTEQYALGVRYPDLGEEKMNRMLREDALGIVDAVEQSYRKRPGGAHAVITLDYELVPCNEQYTTVVYHLIQDFSDGAPRQHQVRTFLYDLKHGQRIPLEKVFAASYPEFMSRYVREWAAGQETLKELAGTDAFLEATRAEWEAFSRVSYSTEGITVYFDAGQLADVSQGMLKLTVPAEEISMLMRRDILDPASSVQPDQLPEGIDPNKPMIALTFDDGPYTPVGNRILDALEQVGGRATFFYLGERVHEGTAGVIQRAKALGCEIGSHSYDHANLTKLEASEIWDQFSRTDQNLKKVAGVTADILRPPFGAVNDTVKETVAKPIVTWSVDTLDWKSRDAEKIAKEILENAKDGDIVLMHELYPSTAEACEQVIPKLAEEYQLVTVKELMQARGIQMQNGKIYYRAGKK